MGKYNLPENMERAIKALIRCCTAEITSDIQAQQTFGAETQIGTLDNGTPVYRSVLTATNTPTAGEYTWLHNLNIASYVNLQIIKQDAGDFVIVPAADISISDENEIIIAGLTTGALHNFTMTVVYTKN
jgi:hypothetical protein